MSLFKAREWWTTKCGSEELFDYGLLAVGNVDNSESGCAKIIVGSFQGYIRVFEPHPPGFVAGHVLLEKDVGFPIIQLAVGHFLANTEKVCLCVLSPHRLAIYAVSLDNTDGSQGISSGNQNQGVGQGAEPSYSLVSLYTHQLRRTAANMTCGHFDTQNNVEQICVQSMDGQLSFYTPSSHAFSSFLPDFLLPGPLACLSISNAIITCNSAHQLLFFRYQSLAMTSCSHDDKEQGNTGKKLMPERQVNLGEHLIQLQVIQSDTSSSSSAYILVLGERSLYCLNQNGVVLFMKKLEVGASCVWAYQFLPPGKESAGSVDSSGRSGSGRSSSKSLDKIASGRPRDQSHVGVERGVVMSMLATHSGQLLVMQDDALVWTASLLHTPIHITTANFKELRGVLVSLDQRGEVICSYLGTDPTLFTATPTSGTVAPRSNTSDQEIERELSTINKSIKSSSSGLSVEMKGSCAVQLSTVCDPSLVRIVEVDRNPEDFQANRGDEGKRVESGEELGEQEDENYKPVKKCLEVQVLIKCDGRTVTNVTISVNASLPLTTHPTHFRLSEVSCSDAPDALILTVVCTPSLLPVHTSLWLSTTYTSQQNQVEVVDHEVRLPLQLFCEPTYPEKTGQFKVTVDAAPCEGNLSKLFPSVLILPEAPPHALGLRYLCGPVVTVVASKTATQRYRLQSNSLPAMGVALQWLLHRLQAYYRGASPAFSAKFTPPLPLSEYFEILERHYQVRQDLEQCYEWLDRHAHQFRAIQKRLLTRFKDKTPVGLAHLDTLLDGTYMQLNALIDKSEGVELELKAVTNHLACATLLIITLLRLAANLGEEDFAILTATFCPHISTDTTDQGWEEQVDVGLVHLLQTSLSKSAKEQTSATPLSLSSTPDCHKVKKHVALLCDRILKGYRPSGPRLEVTQFSKAGSSQEVAPVVLDPPPVTATLSKDPLAAAPAVATSPYRKHPGGPTPRRPSMPSLQEHVGEAPP